MLFIAEGQIRGPIEPADHTVAAAWVGSMVDSGFVQAGYLDAAGQRVILVLSAEDRVDLDQRLGDLPIVREQKVSFNVSHVTALRFS
jgi:hypothetical protein